MIKENKLIKIFSLISLIVLLTVILLPIISILGTSLKSPGEIFTNNSLFPNAPTFENYVKVFNTSNFGCYVLNSIFVSLTVTLVSTFFAALAGYALSRYRTKIRLLRYYSKLLLLLQMFPIILILVPLYRIFAILKLVGTLWSVILAYGAFSLPLAVWLLQGFFDGIPKEIEEAGSIDGCSPMQVFLKIVVPISSAGIASAGIFTFIYCWNEFMLASVFLKNDNVKTLSVGITTFIQQFGSEWGTLMAAAIMTIIPVAFFLVFMQKYIIQGMTAGAVKG